MFCHTSWTFPHYYILPSSNDWTSTYWTTKLQRKARECVSVDEHILLKCNTFIQFYMEMLNFKRICSSSFTILHSYSDSLLIENILKKTKWIDPSHNYYFHRNLAIINYCSLEKIRKITSIQMESIVRAFYI